MDIIAEAIKGIRNLPSEFYWTDINPWAVDAIRGSLYEIKWRGTLTEYSLNNPMKPILDRTLDRLFDFLYEIVEPEWPITYTTIPSNGFPLNSYRIGLGTYGWKYDVGVIWTALAAGIRLIDTGESYGYGRTEKALGQAIIDGYSPALMIATKVARNHLSYQSVLNAAKRSHKRLGQIDLYQIHWPNPKYPIQDTMEALWRLIEIGLVAGVGVCNMSIDQLRAAQYIFHPHRIQSVQVRYNLLDRGIERALLPYCTLHDIPVIAYSPLGQKFKSIIDADEEGVLANIAEDYAVTEAQITLAWIMAKGAIPIPRTNNFKHVHEIAESVKIKLTSEHIKELDEAFPILE